MLMEFSNMWEVHQATRCPSLWRGRLIEMTDDGRRRMTFLEVKACVAIVET